MKIKVLIMTLFSVPLLSWSSSLREDSNFAAYKSRLQQDLQQKTRELNVCRAECRQTYSYYTKTECDRQVCHSQKTAYNQVKGELDKISGARHALDTRQATVNQMLNRWNACQSRCRNDSNTEHNAQHCRDVICANEKRTYESYRAEADRTDDNLEKAERDQETAPSSSKKSEAVVNQIRSTRDKVGVLGYVAAGTTAFLGYRAAVCASQCGGMGGGGCCYQAPMYGVMASLGAVQTSQMFKKRKSLNQTCRDLSSNGYCSPVDPNGGDPDVLKPPNPLPPGCKANPSLCNPNVYLPSAPCSAGDPNCAKPGQNNPAPGSLAGNEPDPAEILAKAFEPEGGWPDGKNPFEDNEEFDYNSLSSEQRGALEKAMKNFNQQKKNYMAQNGLLDDSKNGRKKGGVLATAELLEDIDLSAAFNQIKEADTGSLTGKASNRGRKRAGGRGPASNIEKIQQMLLGGLKGANEGSGNLSGMSVSIGNDNVGVREDNIFLMVHRMNRKLDEEQGRFIVDF